MAEFIIISIIVAVFAAIISYTLISGAIAAKKEGRSVKYIIAIIFGLIAIVATFATMFSGLFPSEYLVGAPIIVSLVIIPLSWVAMAYVKGWKKFVMFFLPGIPLVLSLLVIMTASLGGNLPLKESEAMYTSQEDIEELLGIGPIPKLKFDHAADASDGKKVWLLLENPSDSTKLSNAFDLLKKKHPLQCEDQKWDGHLYQMVNDDTSSFVNVKFENVGIAIVYGSIWVSYIISDFELIQAPMPEYEYVTYYRDQGRSDFYHKSRVRFKQPLSQTWLSKVKYAASRDSEWSYNEDRKYIDIKFENSQRYSHMKIYKNFEGKRTIADIEWGDY